MVFQRLNVLTLTFDLVITRSTSGRESIVPPNLNREVLRDLQKFFRADVIGLLNVPNRSDLRRVVLFLPPAVEHVSEHR